MSPARLALAILAGAFLGATPFLRYAHLGGRGEEHADHEARHGGQLGMTGEHHLEIVRRRGRVEIFVSDPWRRPVVPQQGWIAYDGAERQLLSWEGDRLAGADHPGTRRASAIVLLGDGTRLSVDFDLDDGR